MEIQDSLTSQRTIAVFFVPVYVESDPTVLVDPPGQLGTY